MGLAERLGMTVGELRSKMSHWELALWEQEFKLRKKEAEREAQKRNRRGR